MITVIKLANTSATHPLRIGMQNRKQYPVATAAAPRQRRTLSEIQPDEQEALEERGAETVETRIPAPYGSIGLSERVVPMPRWQADGEPTLANWVARSFANAEQEAVAAAAASAPSTPGIRICEEWSAARPHDTVLPRAETSIRCDDNTRYLLQSEDPGAYAGFHNPSPFHWFAARVLDPKGNAMSTTHVGPGQHATVFLGKHGAVIEQRPT